MIKEELRKKIPEGYILFENPSFDASIIGTYQGRIVYLFYSMVNEFVQEGVSSKMYTKVTEEEFVDAMDFINYNTLGALTQPNHPLVVEVNENNEYIDSHTGEILGTDFLEQVSQIA